MTKKKAKTSDSFLKESIEMFTRMEHGVCLVKQILERLIKKKDRCHE